MTQKILNFERTRIGIMGRDFYNNDRFYHAKGDCPMPACVDNRLGLDGLEVTMIERVTLIATITEFPPMTVITLRRYERVAKVIDDWLRPIDVTRLGDSRPRFILREGRDKIEFAMGYIEALLKDRTYDGRL